MAANEGADPYMLGVFMEMVHKNAVEIDNLIEKLLHEWDHIPIKRSIKEEHIKDKSTAKMRALFENEQINFEEYHWEQISDLLDRIFCPLDNNAMIEQ